MKKSCLYILLSWLLTITACDNREKVEPAPKAKADLRLEATDFANIPNWNFDNQEQAWSAFMLSCQKIILSKNEYIDNSRIKIKTADYQKLCQQAAAFGSKNFKQVIEQNLTPYKVIYKDSDKGKFTAYYEPMIHVDFEKNKEFRYPIHAKPLDMIEFNPHDFDEKLPPMQLVGRIENKRLIPYYNRSQIVEGKGDIPVLLWADSMVDLHIMHIQGPAVGVLPNGQKIRISYAATNGLKFKGIGSILAQNNELSAGQLSMINIKNWLKQNPDKAQEYMNQNNRYVFHRLIGADGPLGAMGLPLTEGRSLAVDSDFIPLGALLWIDTTAPDNQPLQKLVNAQDVGAAIKGAVRGDYYWGSGGDEVLEKAGKMNSDGSYYILLPRKDEINEQKNSQQSR